jgi:preprotein translocase subunit SecB
MSESTAAPQGPSGAPNGNGAAPILPPLVVNIQFVKDLSFEVPGAPEIFSTLRAQPNVQINLDVQARRLTDGQNVFEVVLVVKADASEPLAEGQTEPARKVFIAELAYAGVFTLNGVPDNSVEPVLLIECPRLLFPYARNILADVTRDGGFPPVLLQPIDFVSLWQARKQNPLPTTAV